MLDVGLASLQAAYRNGYALPAFSVYDLAQLRAVCRAGERARRPLIVQAGASAFRFAGRAPLAAAALAAAAESGSPVGVHLDHSRDLDELRWCVELGYSSVMIDGSHLPLADNIALTRAAAEIAHGAGAWLEGELGALAGDEDRADRVEGGGTYTDPAVVADFVARTGVDCLAVSIGNIHGSTPRPPDLDLELLAAIRDRCPVPLVLHGASGLDPAVLASAFAFGVAKVNVNTELRKACLTSLAVGRPSADGYDMAAFFGPATAAMESVAAGYLRV